MKKIIGVLVGGLLCVSGIAADAKPAAKKTSVKATQKKLPPKKLVKPASKAVVKIKAAVQVASPTPNAKQIRNTYIQKVKSIAEQISDLAVVQGKAEFWANAMKQIRVYTNAGLASDYATSLKMYQEMERQADPDVKAKEYVDG